MLEKQSKLPRYSMKCRGKRNTTRTIPRSITFSPLHIAESRLTLGQCSPIVPSKTTLWVVANHFNKTIVYTIQYTLGSMTSLNLISSLVHCPFKSQTGKVQLSLGGGAPQLVCREAPIGLVVYSGQLARQCHA